MRDVPLNPGIPGGKWARLRSLCGRDENLGTPNANLIGEGETIDLVAFIDALLTEAPGTTVRSGRAADLAVSDFDRICASIYIEYFGEFVEGRIACNTCDEPFEMRFSLRSLMQDLDRRPSEVGGPDEQGVFTCADGRRFRLPTAGEQREMLRVGTDSAMATLLHRCVLDGDPGESLEIIEKSMEQVGPVLDLDLDAMCANCGTVQLIRFDIRPYLLRALSDERQFLLYETHRIAMAYRWSHEEILALRREDRRKFAGLIESERTRRTPS